MILTPCGPRAVPIGGAGLAFPAGICSLTTALTRFAIQFYTPRNSLDFLDLQEIQYHRRFSTEKGNKYSDLVPIHIDVADRADELRERSIDDTHALAFREADFSLWLCLISTSSSMGTITRKILLRISIEAIRASRWLFTLFS